MGNGTNPGFGDIINGDAGSAKLSKGISTKTFVLNLATALGLFAFNLVGFFLLRSAAVGRRIYQPKTYLVQPRLRVESVPTNAWRWLKRLATISDEELTEKCGLDGYLFIRFVRALIIIFAPLMAILVTVLLPVNYNDGKGTQTFRVGNQLQKANVTGLDTLSWQNVAPDQTQRYWAHLVCALLVIGWSLWRIYREKLHFISARQRFLLSPEHRIKPSARTILVTNIPSEYHGDEALSALYDVFVDNDDRDRLKVWVNRDYAALRALVASRRSLRHKLEKEELKLLRLVNKHRRKKIDAGAVNGHSQTASANTPKSRDGPTAATHHQYKDIETAFEEDCREQGPLWRKYLNGKEPPQVTIAEDGNSMWNTVSTFQLRRGTQQKKVPKTAWLRYEIARCTLQIEEMTQSLDNESRFPRQNSAFIQFDRQMSANMACSLVSHHLPGRMAPRFIDVAPHEILWGNMNITGKSRFLRAVIALFLFVVMIVLWGIPAFALGFLSQLALLRASVTWLRFLRPWPSWLISFISGPLSSILLVLLVQLVVPALCRKLAVLWGAPTRSKREVLTQAFYFTFLFIELVLVSSISSGLIATIPAVIKNPTTIATTLATNLPKAANYFFNFLIIQCMGLTGRLLFQVLRLLYITTCWPFFTQTPREEAWLQTTIPHQMWGNVYPLVTNLAAIAIIYSVIAPLILIIITISFALLWLAYRHNYYYVQRNKVETHGILFGAALSQLFAGIYTLGIALIGLFFLVRDTQDNVACTPQAIIMIVTLALTGAYQYCLEDYMQPLYNFLPVSLEDSAAEAEQKRFADSVVEEDAGDSARPSLEAPTTSTSYSGHHDRSTDFSTDQEKPQTGDGQAESKSGNDARTKKTLMRLRTKVATKVASNETGQAGVFSQISRRISLGNQLGASLASYPDELTDLSRQERKAELEVAYEDPVTREPPPIIWIPQDTTRVSEEILTQSRKYGVYLQYSNAGAYLSKNNKCEITRPSPDVRTDWLLDWVL